MLNIEDKLRELTLPPQLVEFIGGYHKALVKRAELGLVGESEYLCFQRFIEQYNSGRYVFAEKGMRRMLQFLHLLIFIDEDGKPHRLELYPVQKFILCAIFGLRHPDGRYLVSVANIYVARRNGKSFLLGGIGHSLMGMSRFRNELIILASCKGENAKICFNEFAKFIDNDKALKEQYSNISKTAGWAIHKYTRNRLELFKTGAGAKKQLDGFTNKVAIIDEEMLCGEIITKSIQDGQAHFKDSLLVTLSTAQYEIGSDNHKKWLTLRKQLHEGTLPEETFLFLAEPDYEDVARKDYAAMSFWGKANPVLLFEKDGYTVKEHIRKKYVAKAKAAMTEKGFALQTFCTKQANIWYAADDRAVVPYDKLKACAVDYSFTDVINAGYRDWYTGIDLAQVLDLASVAWMSYIGVDDDGKIVPCGEPYARQRLFVHIQSWMPKNKLQMHIEADKFCYYDYVGTELQLCEAAGGDNIDTEQIYQAIADTAETYGLHYVTMTADPYNIAGIEARLEDICDTFILQNQSPKALSQYIEALSQQFKDGVIAYARGQEDLLEKAITNSVLVRNSSGFYSVEKISLRADSNIRIDPLDATINGFIACWIDHTRDGGSADEAVEDWLTMFD